MHFLLIVVDLSFTVIFFNSPSQPIILNPGEEETFITTSSYTAKNSDELTFEKGVLVEVFQKGLDGWWKGRLDVHVHVQLHFTCSCLISLLTTHLFTFLCNSSSSFLHPWTPVSCIGTRTRRATFLPATSLGTMDQWALLKELR